MHKLVDKVEKASKTTADEKLQKAKKKLLKAKKNKEQTDQKNNVARIQDPEEKRAEMDRALGRKPKPAGQKETKLKQALKDYDKLLADKTGASEFIGKLALTQQNIQKKMEKQQYEIPDKPANETAPLQPTPALNETQQIDEKKLNDTLKAAKKATEKKLKKLQNERKREEKEMQREEQEGCKRNC